MTIERFQGEHRWLSNFWQSTVRVGDDWYPTVEHAYQAAKTTDPDARRRIRLCATPGDAKRAGRGAPMREGWEGMKILTMHQLLRQKFREPVLREKLLSTGCEQLIEGNEWNDTFWGVCRGRGANNLGKLLMQVRAEIRKEL